MKPQWTFVRSRYLRCNIPNLICPRLPVLYQWQFCKACLFQITFSGLHESSIGAAAAAGWWRVRRRYLQVTSGSTLTRWPLKLAPVWRLTAARPADMFPGEGSAIMSHLNLTINKIEKLEEVCRYIILGPIQTLGTWYTLRDKFYIPRGVHSVHTRSKWCWRMQTTMQRKMW